jgi:hypothetical protein
MALRPILGSSLPAAETARKQRAGLVTVGPSWMPPAPGLTAGPIGTLYVTRSPSRRQPIRRKKCSVLGCSRATRLLSGLRVSKRASQATTMAAIDAAARLDQDWLSRGMSDPARLDAHARRYRELKGREITWVLPGLRSSCP